MDYFKGFILKRMPAKCFKEYYGKSPKDYMKERSVKRT